MTIFPRNFIPILLVFFTTSLTLLAQRGEKPDSPKVSLIAEVAEFTSSQPFELAVQIEHPESYHSYYKVDAFNLPLLFEFDLPEGFTHSPITWPVPKVVRKDGILSLYYEKNQYFTTTITPPANFKAAEANLSLKVRVQLCRENACLPPKNYTASLSLVHSPDAKINTVSQQTIERAKKTQPQQIGSWKSRASIQNNHLVLSIQSPQSLSEVKGLTFAPDLKIIDFLAPQEITHDGLSTQITIPIELDGDVQLPEQLHGLLLSETGVLIESLKAVVINTPLLNKSNSSQASSSQLASPASLSKGDSEHNVKADTALEVEAMAKLYETAKEESISYITVDQIPENLNDLEKLTQAAQLSRDKVANTSILGALGLVFLGGMILNLMPCVFPVLGVKVLGFVQLSGNDPKKIKLHGLAFTSGLIIAMWLLAGIILAIQASTNITATWGEQMGNPVFVASIIVILVLFGLNLYGLFEIGTSLTGAGGDLQSKKGYSGSFFSGALTTLIATPCSGPFLGATMGFTLSQPPITAMLIFTVFALGIAFPYALLAFFPKLINALPRPGAWMVTFKKIMAFPMILTAAFFLRTFGHQTGVEGLWWFSMALVVFAFASFCYGHWGTPFQKKKPRFILGYGFSLLLLVAATLMTYSATKKVAPVTDALEIGKGGLKWKPWKPGKAEHSRQQGKPLWVDYTATWCGTCQTNKLAIFTNQEVLDLIKQHDLELVKVDMTLTDSVKKEDLARAHRKIIPVNLIYPAHPDRPAVLLEEAITAQQALKALRYAFVP